jgi:hypothetical protein
MIKHLKLFTLCTSLILGFLFFGCDKIEGPYGVAGNVTPPDSTSDTIVRKVLLEDFTGHICQACPAAHDEAKRLQDIYGDRLIVLSIHAGYFATTNPVFVNGNDSIYQKDDFNTTTGTSIATDFNLINLSFPKGMINRLYKASTSSQYIFDWPDWEVTVDTILQRPADAGLTINNSFNTMDSLMTSNVSVKMINDYANPVNLAVYFAEDSIIAPQKMSSTPSAINVLNYVHRHVLRGAFLGTYGETIANSTNAGQVFNKTYNIKLSPSTANANQVYIYAILFDNITKEILQVEEKKLIP